MGVKRGWKLNLICRFRHLELYLQIGGKIDFSVFPSLDCSGASFDSECLGTCCILGCPRRQKYSQANCIS